MIGEGSNSFESVDSSVSCYVNFSHGILLRAGVAALIKMMVTKRLARAKFELQLETVRLKG